MDKVRAFIHYETTDRPWGGSNSFLHALKSYLSSLDDMEVVADSRDDFDLLVLNTAYAAPGKYLSLREVKRYRSCGYPGPVRYLLGRLKKRDIKIILRLDGLRRFYAGTPGNRGDIIQLRLTKFADAIIFQSSESLNQFRKELGGIASPHYVIHNGVDQNVFNMKDKVFWNKKDRLNIFATSWSANPRKGFSDIARLSLLRNVSVHFAGNWPREISRENVAVQPPMPHHLLSGEYKKYDVFFFPSRDEACPNVVYEALSCGLPVIYHPSGGTPEIAAGYGVEMAEDLQDSIALISQKYDTCLDRIKDDRRIFSIEHAGKKYADVFHKVTTGAHTV